MACVELRIYLFALFWQFEVSLHLATASLQNFEDFGSEVKYILVARKVAKEFFRAEHEGLNEKFDDLGFFNEDLKTNRYV
jgi:hypothetical protein